MPSIEVQGFFYDMIHCKDKIVSVFDTWDEKYDDDERGALVAGIRESTDQELINLLVNIQRMAQGYEQIKDLMNQAEQAEVDAQVAADEEGSEDDDDF